MAALACERMTKQYFAVQARAGTDAIQVTYATIQELGDYDHG